MADFRRWVLALTVLALVFSGLASAQTTTGGNSAMNCTAYSTPQTMRSEGYAELIGDIQIVCTGGSAIPVGNAIPTANISITLPKTVTSRIIGGASEALLLIDEPGTAAGQFGGFGAGEGLTLCTNAASSGNNNAYLAGAGLGGCFFGTTTSSVPDGTLYANTITVGGNVYQVASISKTTATAGAPNAYQGIVSGSTITFQGIPILPPVSSGINRSFRITNVRMDAYDYVGGGVGPTGVNATFTISPPTALQINNSSLTVGYVEQSLSTSVGLLGNNGKSSTTPYSQPLCNGTGGASIGTLVFKELFGTAFKPRFSPVATNIGSASVTQATPGFIYNSESGFIPGTTGITISSTQNSSWSGVGVADFGTRFKAVFTNIPAGVSVIVNNYVTNTDGSQIGLVTGETTVDGSTTATAPSTTNPAGAPLASTTLTSTSAFGAGSATAVWEVLTTFSNVNESFSVPVSFSYATNVNVSTSSTVTVTLSYAPIESLAGANIPRFAATSSSPTNILSFSVCQTALLFPYVVYTGGYDTGIEIANTSADPFSTLAQSGTCSMSWYQGTTNPPTNTLGAGNGYGTTTPIAAGTVAYMTASANLPAGFIGYGIAVCNFQYAHGFAIVQDLGGQRFGAGYLALVLSRTTATAPVDFSDGLDM